MVFSITIADPRQCDEREQPSSFVNSSFFFFFCVSIYTPQQLPNTRARHGLIRIKGLGTCTERLVRQGRKAGEVSRRLHLAPGRVERVINSESEICRFGTGCSGSVSWGFVGRRVCLGVVGSFEGRGVLEEEDEGVVAFLEVEDVFEGEVVEVESGFLVLGAFK